jgi:uncharacterized protein DUF6779
MRGHQDEDVSWRSAPARSPGGATRREPAAPAGRTLRSLGLAVGFLIAAAATLAAFVTDDPRYLRLAVVAVAWAFVLAAFLAVRRRTEQRTAAGREDELRRSYEAELEREAAAHREYELELENHLRREAEDAMRGELTGLRSEVAELNLLRHEVARLARLGTDLGALSGLRADVAALAALRDDVASLTGLRGELASLAALREDIAGLTELKADVGRLRTELSEQFNGEMLIERIMLRTQGSRMPGEQNAMEGGRRTAEAPTATWEDDRPPHELHSAAAGRADELSGGRRPEPVPGHRPEGADGRVADPVPARAWEPPAPATAAFPLDPATAAPPSFAAAQPSSAAGAASTPVPPTPLEWLADRSLVERDDLGAAPRARHSLDLPPAGETGERRGRMPGDVLAPIPPRRRRTDEPLDGRTEERPQAPATNVEIARPSPTRRPSPHPRTAPQPVTPAPAVGEDTESAGHQRLAEILAENGAASPPGGRRRRRYRDDAGDPGDDVLARVLRQD